MNKLHNLKHLKYKRQELRNEATDAEKFLWYELRKSQLHGKKFRRQHSVGKYILDFYCPEVRLAIELDGEHHYEVEQKLHDEKRTEYLNSLKIKVIRFKNTDVIFNRDKVVSEIEKHLSKVG